MNRLANTISPYLQQHAGNPVDWFPWGDEAQETAKREDKPIFLSIGYSTCHWCHVMAHESFENKEIASILNKNFISIKVDREERPDLDDLYMDAVQMLTGAGGWPLTVFLTPDLQPFYGGTYFPPDNRMGRVGFRSVLNQLSDAWKSRRHEVVGSAEQLTSRMSRGMQFEGSKPVDTVLEDAVAELRKDFDETFGGFGGAPKFPQSMQLSFLMRRYREFKDKSVLNMVTKTLDHMAMGGMYDHVAGGFYRYSTDKKWLLPHFEKMLYDNALLTSVYLEAYQLTGNRDYLRIGEDTLGYVEEQMTSPEGAFFSAEDADSEGKEGEFYLWELAEIDEILGENADRFITFFGMKKSGNFASHEAYHKGKNNPYGESVHYPEGIAEDLAKLKAVRAERVRPSRDEKTIVSWNGLMITAFADAYRVTGREQYRNRAETAMNFLLSTMKRDGKLFRIYRAGTVQQAAFLEDYTFLGNALLQLYEATLDPKWIDEAHQLAEVMREDFLSEDLRQLFTTAEYHTDLIARKESIFDSVIPSGLSSGIRLFYRLSVYLSNDLYGDIANSLLQNQAGLMERAPLGCAGLLSAAALVESSPLELTVAQPEGKDVAELIRRINDLYLPDRHLYLNSGSPLPAAVGKDPVDNEVTLYRCEHHNCFPPEKDTEKLLIKLVA